MDSKHIEVDHIFSYICIYLADGYIGPSCIFLFFFKKLTDTTCGSKWPN